MPGLLSSERCMMQGGSPSNLPRGQPDELKRCASLLGVSELLIITRQRSLARYINQNVLADF